MIQVQLNWIRVQLNCPKGGFGACLSFRIKPLMRNVIRKGGPRQVVRMDSGGPHQFERDLRQSSRPEGPAKFSSVTVGEGTLLRQGLDPTRKEIFQRRLWPLVAERFKVSRISSGSQASLWRRRCPRLRSEDAMRPVASSPRPRGVPLEGDLVGSPDSLQV